MKNKQILENDDYCFEAEKSWRESLPKYKDKLILELLPEAKEIIPIKIKEYVKAVQEKEEEIQNALAKIYALKTDEFSEFFGEEMVKLYLMPDLEKLEKNLFRLKRLHYLINPQKKESNWIKFGKKIEIAKEYPIEELARSKLDLKKAGRNFVSLCPLHNEKTPSFYIYPDSNQFHCYGCQEHGDVINLTMALYDLEFKEAVEMLQN